MFYIAKVKRLTYSALLTLNTRDRHPHPPPERVTLDDISLQPDSNENR